MIAAGRYLGASLRLHLRNRMGLLYGYLFPTLFLAAYAVLYRFDQPPLVRHMGELLTVTVLGGACFGFPTSLVAERDRGVWRRYRLSPVPTGSLLAGTMLARYLLLLSAGLLQIALALLIGMPFPKHPLQLWAAFTLVGFALLGLGLVIAALADNVPAVQALGQCIFLPMLIIGGIAVRLESLPAWAQRASTFFPGRYAVEAMDAAVAGEGIGSERFALLALLLIGVGALVPGVRMFRWDSQQRFSAVPGRGWAAAALVPWIAVGLLAEPAPRRQAPVAPVATGPASAPRAAPAATPAATRSEPANSPAPAVAAAPPPGTSPGAAPVAPPPAPPDGPVPAPPATGWAAVTAADIDRLSFRDLPPDEGVVAPIAPAAARPDAATAEEIACIRRALPGWKPGAVADPVQRVRNHLYVAAVPDVLQLETIEGLVPHLVLERLQQSTPRDDLVRILYWIATHPAEGEVSAIDRVGEVCLEEGASNDVAQVRQRTAMYATKLLGRLTGRIAPR